eukprot:11160702-Lingulodinium_polyedra.AAC.1
MAKGRPRASAQRANAAENVSVKRTRNRAYRVPRSTMCTLTHCSCSGTPEVEKESSAMSAGSLASGGGAGRNLFVATAAFAPWRLEAPLAGLRAAASASMAYAGSGACQHVANNTSNQDSTDTNLVLVVVAVCVM